MRKHGESGCPDLATDRMRYFTGRYMTARDFRDEQNYHLTHRHLHNRILHGWGVACGLYVHPHPQPDCQTTHVLVDCGMAIDCCGREIVVPRAIPSPPLTRTDTHGGHADAATQAEPQAQHGDPGQTGPRGEDELARERRRDGDGDAEHDRRWYALLCLEYCESEIEIVPVLYSERTCDKPRSEHSRVRESFKLSWHWVRRHELSTKYFWRTLGGGHRQEHDRDDDDHHDHDRHDHDDRDDDDRRRHGWPHDDCDEPDRHGSRCCLDPLCPPHHCVPIAVVSVRPGEPIRREHIDMIGRPAVKPAAESLTHITSINWPHGGVVTRSELERRLRRLEIRFDRRLRRSKHDHERTRNGPTGINSCTFVVQYGGGAEDEDFDFVPYTQPPHVEHDRIAVYSMEGSRRRHDHAPFAYLEHHTVYIALKCDFVLDCHGNPVDGNHLGGLLPSGDGTRGGTFESWFTVVPDHERDRYRHDERRQEQQS